MEKLEHKLRDQSRDVHIVPSLQHFSLLRTSKMEDAKYNAIYDNDEVNFYDGNTVKVKVSEEAVLRGYKCPQTKLWRFPLRPNIINETTDTLILDSPTGMTSLKAQYEVPSTNTITDTLNFMIQQAPKMTEAINNIYDLPRIEPTI